MTRLHYWTMRLVRRSIPQRMVEWMLDRGVLMQPGLDTRAPEESVAQLAKTCERLGRELRDRTVCVVGYGGSFGIGVALLDAGVRHVILQDPYAPRRHARIRSLDERRWKQYFCERDGAWEPNPRYLTVVREHLDVYAANHPCSVDVTLSSSVLEHVEHVDRLIEACGLLTRPGGLGVHAVDLRDHYFRYPFEMLCYDEATWRGWLDSSHLNRWRLPDYERVFARHFAEYRLTVTQALSQEFQRTKHRIRPEFLTGNDEIDSVGTVRIEALKAA